MNYLAHFYLSFNDPEILVGNFLGDFVRKKEFEQLPDKIQKGVLLHRAIDDYMDTHPVSRLSKSFFSSHRHYSNVIIDVVYDHFLAKNWEQYSSKPLIPYAEECYNILEGYDHHFNHKAGMLFYYMKKRNWIKAYPTVDGISQIFRSMAKRTPYETTMNTAAIDLTANYNEINEQFFQFFPEIETFAKSYLGISNY